MISWGLPRHSTTITLASFTLPLLLTFKPGQTWPVRYVITLSSAFHENLSHHTPGSRRDISLSYDFPNIVVLVSRAAAPRCVYSRDLADSGRNWIRFGDFICSHDPAGEMDHRPGGAPPTLPFPNRLRTLCLIRRGHREVACAGSPPATGLAPHY